MKSLTLGYQVIAAVVLGITAGIFFGPFCTTLQPIADIYIMLVQMVALPYICFSLIHGLGSMTPRLGKRLFSSGWMFWMGLWAIVLVVVYALNFLIPSPQFMIIHASSDEGARLAKNFLNYLVPENPLYDLINNAIPALAAFGAIFGVALMHLQKKEPILSVMGRGTELLEKVLIWLAIISPLGIFTRIALVFGTTYFEEVYSLAFYVLGFIVAVLIITLWILPALISSLIPLTYAEILKAFKAVCLLPFATAMPTLALPLIITYMKSLSSKHHRENPHFISTSQTALPICYSFGQIGNCLILFFILFLSFYFRHPFSGWEKAVLSVFMIPMSFGSSTTSVNVLTYLIGLLELPPESILMFKQTIAVTLNFQVLLNAASILTFLILALYTYYGSLRINWNRIVGHSLSIVLICGLCIVIIKPHLQLTDNFHDQFMKLTISDVIPNPVQAKIFPNYDHVPIQSSPSPSGSAAPLERILHSGVLRVGYSTLDLPYSYLNGNGELVGYDIAYAYQLARELDCTLEFIPIEYSRMAEQLNANMFDLAMAAVVMDENRILTMGFTEPYEEQDFVLIIPVNRMTEFAELKNVETNPNLRLSTYGLFTSIAKRHFPQASIMEMHNADPILFSLIEGKADAALWTKSQAFAWCLNHPDYVPIDYGGALGKCYFAYPVKMGSSIWISFLNHWLNLKRQDGFEEHMDQFWLLGQDIKVLPPRWSVIRNVLHWVD